MLPRRRAGAGLNGDALMNLPPLDLLVLATENTELRQQLAESQSERQIRLLEQLYGRAGLIERGLL